VDLDPKQYSNTSLYAYLKTDPVLIHRGLCQMTSCRFMKMLFTKCKLISPSLVPSLEEKRCLCVFPKVTECLQLDFWCPRNLEEVISGKKINLTFVIQSIMNFKKRFKHLSHTWKCVNANSWVQISNQMALNLNEYRKCTLFDHNNIIIIIFIIIYVADKHEWISETCP